MPGPDQFATKVYKALERPEFLPDDFKTWLPRYLRYLSQLQISRQQIPGVMGEIWRNVGDTGQPAFISPWRHYQGGGSAYGKMRFYKDYMGIVHLEGLVDTTGTPTAGQPIFTLPVGYRPSQTLIVFCQGNAPSPTYAPTRVDVNVNGDIAPQNPTVAAFTINSWLSLSGIHFRAA